MYGADLRLDGHQDAVEEDHGRADPLEARALHDPLERGEGGHELGPPLIGDEVLGGPAAPPAVQRGPAALAHLCGRRRCHEHLGLLGLHALIQWRHPHSELLSQLPRARLAAGGGGLRDGVGQHREPLNVFPGRKGPSRGGITYVRPMLGGATET
eukprot:CAMPEP_0170279654 /NCGR_PEP_ID=MMETSP0116_2-20130129/39838_1 /TAXON_ID=400756 /ORGANISM="Durinskia baltica, Strain CSIRO CS-38" /LENGTH=154 /DNA_ID=CAMNT_0010530979 /DNA_START=135 /DNA_END=595 /DNA_ORIENTATION=+